MTFINSTINRASQFYQDSVVTTTNISKFTTSLLAHGVKELGTNLFVADAVYNGTLAVAAIFAARKAYLAGKGDKTSALKWSALMIASSVGLAANVYYTWGPIYSSSFVFKKVLNKCAYYSLWNKYQYFYDDCNAYECLNNVTKIFLASPCPADF